MTIHREPTEAEKTEIRKQHTRDGKVRCFVNDHPIENEANIDYHHIKPFAHQGPTETTNLAPVCREHHKKIGTLSIIEFRARLDLEAFFNHPVPRRLDDLLDSKIGSNNYGKNIKSEVFENKIKIFLDDKISPLELLFLSGELKDSLLSFSKYKGVFWALLIGYSFSLLK